MYYLIGHNNWSIRLPTDYMIELGNGTVYDKMTNVTVLRNCLFFYSGEKTTLDRIKANFTNESIAKLVHDKFIKINDNGASTNT